MERLTERGKEWAIWCEELDWYEKLQELEDLFEDCGVESIEQLAKILGKESKE